MSAEMLRASAKFMAISPWSLAGCFCVRIPNAILILIGRCSFEPGVPGQSAQLLLLEGIGYVWLFALHDLENVFRAGIAKPSM